MEEVCELKGGGYAEKKSNLVTFYRRILGSDEMEEKKEYVYVVHTVNMCRDMEVYITKRIRATRKVFHSMKDVLEKIQTMAYVPGFSTVSSYLHSNSHERRGKL